MAYTSITDCMFTVLMTISRNSISAFQADIHPEPPAVVRPYPVNSKTHEETWPYYEHQRVGGMHLLFVA